MIENIREFAGMSITFNTTEECNMRCKYCYEIDKRNVNLKLDEAKAFIDLIIDNPDKFLSNEYFDICKRGVVLDFIGGDSFMNIELMDQIAKYFIWKIWTTDNELAKLWRNCYRFSISTNGTLFENEKVRKFCEKYRDVMHVGVSIDGCPEIHDKNRIMLKRGPNGEELGSMQYIMKDWDWYQKTFPSASKSTKATLSRESIPYIYDSLVFMYEKLGICYIHQNFIMEDMGLTKEDCAELDHQLRKCVEYTLKHKNNLYWSMLDRTFANHHNSIAENSSICGSGSMPCVGINGNIYPCFRWAPHTQTAATKDKMVTGNAKTGWTHFERFDIVNEGAKVGNCTKDEKCLTCQYESSCRFCIGGCFAETGEFKRVTHICETAKIQCKWAKVYWNEFALSMGNNLEYDEKYLLKNVPDWTDKYLGTNLGD